MAKLSDKTIQRYTSLWNKLQVSKIQLDTLDKITFSQFRTKTNINSESQFRLAKALMRNPDTQKQVNIYLNKKAIPTTIIKRVSVKQYIPKVVRKPKVPKVKPKVPKTKVQIRKERLRKEAQSRRMRRILAKEKKERELAEKRKQKGYSKLMRIVKDLQDFYGYSKEDALRKARDLLKVPKRDYRYLKRQERIILDIHSP